MKIIIFIMESLGGFAPCVIYFFLYSFIGYLIEIVYCSLAEKKLVNRGFLFGPILPIYGTGMLLVLVSTQNVTDNLILTFLVSMAICTVTEYLISWAMEKIFGIKWWDYSEVYRFHINGRVCLANSLAFGIAGLLIVNQIHPAIANLVTKIPHQEAIAAIFLWLVAIDTIASTYAVKKVEHSIALKMISGDQTNEIKKLARRAIAQLVTGKNFLEQKVDETKRTVKKTVKKQQARVKRQINKLRR